MQPHVQGRGLCAFSEVNKQGNLGLSLLQCLSPLSQCVWQICFPNKPLATAWQKKKKPAPTVSLGQAILPHLTSGRLVIALFCGVFHQYHRLPVPECIKGLWGLQKGKP